MHKVATQTRHLDIKEMADQTRLAVSLYREFTSTNEHSKCSLLDASASRSFLSKYPPSEDKRMLKNYQQHLRLTLFKTAFLAWNSWQKKMATVPV